MGVDWAAAASKVAATLYKESFELYEADHIENEIGETENGLTLIGTYICNIQNTQGTQGVQTPGVRDSDLFRISTTQNCPAERSKVYYVKMISTLKSVPTSTQLVGSIERTNMAIIFNTAGEGP